MGKIGGEKKEKVKERSRRRSKKGEKTRKE